MTGHDGDSRRHAGCVLCWAGDGGDHSAAPGGVEVAHADHELIALVDHDAPGVLVAPRSHVDTLPTAPMGAGALLGALRRVAVAVETSYGATGAAIEPTTELPWAAGHVCYRIAPTVDGVPLPPGTGAGIDVRDVVAALSNAADNDAPPPG